MCNLIERDETMKNLMLDYNQAVKLLYLRLNNFKKNQRNTPQYYMILAEYQHTCFVLRQIKHYCKVRGLI